MTTPAIITRKSLQTLLDNSTTDQLIPLIGKAVTILHNLQRQMDNAVGTDSEFNGVGFINRDRTLGRQTAEYFKRNKFIGNNILNRWLRLDGANWSRLSKYHAQLNIFAIRQAQQAIVDKIVNWDKDDVAA